jgi:ATP phosphoribosyltransferase regulatory subunit
MARKDMADVTALAQQAGGAALLLPALLGAAGPADGALAALEDAALPPLALAIAENAAAIVVALRARAPALRITLDPVEFRGLRYHTGVAFTIFGEGRTGELGRGGRYLSGEEPATGVTLYPDSMLRGLPPALPRRRVFVPRGADPALAAALRAQGFATVVQLAATDTAAGLRCSDVMDESGALRPARE